MNEKILFTVYDNEADNKAVVSATWEQVKAMEWLIKFLEVDVSVREFDNDIVEL